MKTRSPEPGLDLTERIIRLASKMHRKLGPGLYESMDHDCLYWELHHDGLNVRREVPLPMVYEDMSFDKGYRADVIVEDTVLLELKSVASLQPVHTAQILTYLHLGHCSHGLLMNFNCILLKDGLRRFIAHPTHQSLSYP